MNKTAELEEKIDLLLWTGQLLLQSGADSNRIDRNIRRVAAFMGLSPEKLHLHITFTTLMITIGDNVNSFTKFRKCKKHGVNMTVVSAISRLSWKAIKDDYSLEQYREELDRINHIPHHYPRWFLLLSVGMACGAFCLLFGGDWISMANTVVATMVALFVRQELHKKGLNGYFIITVSAFVATSVGSVSTLMHVSDSSQYAILASVLFLIPGVPLINSLDDMLDGFTIVGLTRAIVGLLMVMSISLGMIAALSLLNIETL
ncbi:threonine/serine exporter family protein [Flammeovirgaceae bacterium SG7u.111]|nr:threonine/serine exporter family protein [Flammeovirgaceae bacterium SG7u.132]WPO35886.1 threonine/serine exporter family protein [Flammeovirgaceae bacterium SG7u.111]